MSRHRLGTGWILAVIGLVACSAPPRADGPPAPLAWVSIELADGQRLQLVDVTLLAGRGGGEHRLGSIDAAGEEGLRADLDPGSLPLEALDRLWVEHDEARPGPLEGQEQVPVRALSQSGEERTVWVARGLGADRFRWRGASLADGLELELDLLTCREVRFGARQPGSGE